MKARSPDHWPAREFAGLFSELLQNMASKKISYVNASLEKLFRE